MWGQPPSAVRSSEARQSVAGCPIACPELAEGSRRFCETRELSRSDFGWRRPSGLRLMPSGPPALAAEVNWSPPYPRSLRIGWEHCHLEHVSPVLRDVGSFYQPRSGARMQPTACPERSRRGVSRGWQAKNERAPKGRKKDSEGKNSPNQIPESIKHECTLPPSECVSRNPAHFLLCVRCLPVLS